VANLERNAVECEGAFLPSVGLSFETTPNLLLECLPATVRHDIPSRYSRSKFPAENGSNVPDRPTPCTYTYTGIEAADTAKMIASGMVIANSLLPSTGAEASLVRDLLDL